MDRKNNIITIMLNRYYGCMSYSFLEYCGMVKITLLSFNTFCLFRLSTYFCCFGRSNYECVVFFSG